MLISKVRHTIEKYGMIHEGDKVVVGVSGGPDSVFLLHALNELKNEYSLSLIVACLDHGIRGSESRMECEFVESLAKRSNLPFESHSVDVLSIKKKYKISTQQAARNVRYEFFLDIRRKYSAQKVALGHNADDQAETVLMRLLRGAGLKGLSGIPPVRDGIFVRPLIEVQRCDIEEHLKKNNREYIIDSSNKDDIYLRNKIRNSLVLLLTNHYNPRIVRNLVRASEILRKEDEFLDEIASDFFSGSCVRRNDECVTLDISRLMEFPESMQMRVMRKAIELYSGDLQRIGFKHMESMMGIISQKGANRSINLPGGIIAERRYNELMIRRKREEKPFHYLFNEIPRTVTLEEIGKKVDFRVMERGDDFRLPTDPCIAFLDLSEIKLPLIIRCFKEGDRFQPLGMKGTKKLKDFFVDSKIPKSIRRDIPILVFNEMIVWVMGYRIDHRVMVDESTRKILEVRLL